MAETGISWTDRTWNPTTGCTRVSPGCDHCYAFQLHDQRHLAWKRGTWPDAPAQYRKPFSTVQLMPERLSDPVRWRTPARIFVCSMADLFHGAVPDSFLLEVFATMAIAQQHTFQILTKRPERMQTFVESLAPIFAADMWPLPNVWLGTSVEDQQRADERIPQLLETPAAVRFLSCEPLLGPVDLKGRPPGMRHLCIRCGDGPDAPHDHPDGYRTRGLDWIIAGGESGPHARPCDLDWLRSLRDQCAGAGVAFHLKQLGGRTPPRKGEPVLLDGREWKEFPA